MQKGDVVELTIESVGMDGEGVARLDGMVIFVPFTLAGEVVKCEVVFVKKSFAKAKVIKLLKGAEERVTPLCPHFRKCGGCDMQHITYDRQLEIKRNNVQNCLKKYAGIDANVNPVLPSSDIFYYRNKAQFPLFEKNGKVCLGFYKEKTHDFVQIEKCYLLGEWCDKFCNAFLKVANDLKLTCYNEKTHKGLLRHLVLRRLNDTVSVTVVVNSNKFDYTQNFVKELSKIGTNFSFYVSFNTMQTNLIMTNANVLYGEKDIPTEILGVKTFVNPMSFMQINDNVRDMIYSKVKDLVLESGCKIVVDAYSGVGVLSNIIAQIADQVYGIEIVPEAVANANQLAKINGNNDKITNICGDSAVELPKLAEQINQQLVCNQIIANKMQNEQHSCGWALENTNVFTNKNNFANVSVKAEQQTKGNFDNVAVKAEQHTKDVFGNFAVILDPPRKGCDIKVLQGLLQAKPNKIIYISCSPATLARDISVLKDDYQITYIQPYDMFPNTSHIETLVCLERK